MAAGVGDDGRVPISVALVLALAPAPSPVLAGDAPIVHDDGDCGITAAPDIQSHEPVVDCTQSTDEGYMSGVPFEITVVHIDGKPVEKDTANAYWVMREAAAADGIDMHINSGFRTMEEQEYLYMCYQCGCCNNGNLAAQPGYSNHQSGHALDINTATSGVYGWLAAHGAEYGFENTVASENWHWEWWGGGPGGGICDIAAPPSGSVDAATCTDISGWAQDPDAPDQAITVEIYFDGGPDDPGATGVSMLADASRDDLCDALGSCNHAFSLGFPRGLADGRDHGVRVFALDDAGGANTELAISVASVNCQPPALPAGVRRHIPDPTAFATWKFSALWDLAHVDDAAIEALPEGSELGAAPFLVNVAASTEVWLVDKGFRRRVSPEAAAAWRLDLAAVTTITDDQLVDIDEGTPLGVAPLLAQGSGDAIWLIDDPQHGDGGSGGGSDEGGSEGEGEGGSDGDGGSSDGEDATAGLGERSDEGGCGCTSAPGGGRSIAWTLVGLAVLWRRRRR